MDNGAPPKPWEINRTTSNNNYGGLRSSSSDLGNLPQTTNLPTINEVTPPPVPPRPSERPYQTSSLYSPYSNNYGTYSGYGGYGGMYGGMGGGLYGNSMYNSYNSYNRGYNSFSQTAEDSTRNAFQSVESIVRAFSAISAMLESTFGAVYSSFRAVLDVADHFSRVRATFSDILSSLAVIRFLRFLYRRAMAMLRLRSHDDAWENANATQNKHQNTKPHPGSWPILLFFSVVLGGPYLIWRLLRGESKDASNTDWAKGDSDHVVAVAQYSFNSNEEGELSISAGERLNLAPKEEQPNIQNWLLASSDGKTTGMVPANYVKILGKRRGKLTSNMPPPTQIQSSTSTASLSNLPTPNSSNQSDFSLTKQKTDFSSDNSTPVKNICDANPPNTENILQS